MKQFYYIFRLIVLVLVMAPSCSAYNHSAKKTNLLETERLLLRKVRLDDAQDIAEFASNPAVTSSTALFPPLVTLAEVQDFVSLFLIGDAENDISPRYPMAWSIVHKESNKVIGIVVFCAYSTRHQKAELAYALSPEYWGHGYATEACKAIVNYGLQNNIVRIYATVDPENIASERVLQKIDMSFEGLLRSYMIVNGEPKDRKMYAIVQ